ncbi:protein FAM200A-like [Penaeus japonicus]|uniref:protein FAM200A-like n=1 Tax=Penaeus japonicus TaxID=27405 RepID=UPI001C70DF79|nr:protein FAM200A-like [Penaeus japonicus]
MLQQQQAVEKSFLLFLSILSINPISAYRGLTTLTEEEQLVEMRNDRNLKLLHMQLPLDRFWVPMKAKYPQVAKKALVILIQFSTSYLCELGFSVLANIKTNKRARLQTLEEEMRKMQISNHALEI